MAELRELFTSLLDFSKDGNWKMIIMWLIGGILIYLAIKKCSLRFFADRIRCNTYELLRCYRGKRCGGKGFSGISAFSMPGRIVHKMGLEEDNQNFLLMCSKGVNVSEQIAAAIAGALIFGFFS